MRRLIGYGITTTILAIMGCDPEGGDPEDDTEFRQSVTYVQVQTQTASFKSKSCDPDWWWAGPAAGGAPEFDEKEWMAMIHTQGRMMGEEVLAQKFLGHPTSAKLCNSACTEAGLKWIGSVRATDSAHEFGETEIAGECPYGLVATATQTESKGKIACACS